MRTNVFPLVFACISNRISIDIHLHIRRLNSNCYNKHFAVSSSILTLAWLNLQNKHMTTGRINQVVWIRISFSPETHPKTHLIICSTNSILYKKYSILSNFQPQFPKIFKFHQLPLLMHIIIATAKRNSQLWIKIPIGTLSNLPVMHI